jgi:hypothetical protein
LIQIKVRRIAMRSDALECGAAATKKPQPVRLIWFTGFKGATIMSSMRRMMAAAAMLFGLSVLQPGDVHAFELTGAWASQTDLCTLVFMKKGNQVVFTPLSDLFGSGFIVDGSRIRGRATGCTIKSKKQQGDDLELSAACASSIMTSSVRFNLKVIDDNNLSRAFPEIPGMTLKYSRCSI